MFLEAKNKDPKLCTAYRCKNKKYGKDRFCSKHRRRYTKENNPLGYTFDVLKQNAKTRGKVFTIDLEYFRSFCKETGYLEKKGKTGKSASIDRKDPTKGYEPGNLQVLSLAKNTSKRWEDEKEDLPF